MELAEVVALFNPANAKSLTAEQVASMQTLSKEEVQALADAYPNKATQSAYLILRDNSKEQKKDIFHRSTWKNLVALWRQGAKNLVPYSFVSIWDKSKQMVKVAATQDLSPDEVKKGLAAAKPQTLSPDKKVGDQQPVEKPLDKWNKAELTGKYKELFGSDPDEAMKNKDLIKAIQDKQSEEPVEDISKLDRDQLLAKYKGVFDVDPDEAMTDENLREAISKELSSKE